MATAGGAKCIVLSGDARMVDTVILQEEIILSVQESTGGAL